MADRISRGIRFWEEISDPHRDRVVLDWIRHGYSLEWGDKGRPGHGFDEPSLRD